MNIVRNITSLLILLTFCSQIYADENEKDAGMSVTIIQSNDSLKFRATTKEPKHHLSLLMQGLQVHLACGKDSVHIKFPDAAMVRHKVKRHPNEVKPTFSRDSIGKEVRPDIAPLTHALSDTLAYFNTCGNEKYTSDYTISLNKEENSLSFEICLPDIVFSGDSVFVNILSMPQKGSRREFTGRKLSKEDKANPRGLGEAPVPGTENSRTIDIKMTKGLEIQCVRNSL